QKVKTYERRRRHARFNSTAVSDVAGLGQLIGGGRAVRRKVETQSCEERLRREYGHLRTGGRRCNESHGRRTIVYLQDRRQGLSDAVGDRCCLEGDRRDFMGKYE